MSKTLEYAKSVISIVAHETETDARAIVSKAKTTDVVDARHIAIKLLHSKGIYPCRIAGIFGLSVRAIHYIITSFDDRMSSSRALRQTYERITKQLGNNLETTWK